MNLLAKSDRTLKRPARQDEACYGRLSTPTTLHARSNGCHGQPRQGLRPV
jgi:hypothetical protein